MSSRTGGSGGHGGPAGPAALLAVRVTPADTGRRVTVRRRVEDGLLSDVVGVLRSWDDGVLTVEKRSGEAVDVAYADVVAAKVVAPELSAEAMQELAERGWPAAETARLGDWVLRATSGVTGRANSVRVTGDPGVPPEEALAHVRGWYGERGLPPMVQVPEPSLLDPYLEADGWAPARRTTVRTVATDVLLERSEALAPTGWTVEQGAVPSAAWLALVEPTLPADVLVPILTGPDERVFVSVLDASGALVATGRATGAPSAAGRWAGVTSMAVSPDARRQGLACLVMAELARWASERRCDRTYLQVMAHNAGAIALYERLGLELHHTYAYLSPDPVPDR